ncbi:MAG: hypothetical protein M0R75_16020 [Dehalococcoidia bacterium]|nr:hypothetical protein [Dehalococcoidia bacterium]
MAELIVDFASEPDGTFRGNGQVPAPVVFIRSFNHEGAPVVTSGPLGYVEETDFGPVSRIEDLAAIKAGALMLHAPGDGGFQTVQQPIGMMSCPRLHMEAEIYSPIDRHTERKWMAFWLVPEDEYLKIGGNLSTAADPDFIEVVRNRLPRIPRNSIMWRAQGSPLGDKAWLVQFTGSDTLPPRRNLPWERINAHGSRAAHRVEIRGHHLRLLAPQGDGWELVLEERDIIPPDWAGRNIVLLIEAADYQSWDGGKGDGQGPATRVVTRVRLRAPEVFTLVGGAVPEAPPVEEPPVVEPPAEEPATPPVDEEPPGELEPPVEPDLRPGLERARALIDAELAALEATTA